MLMILVLAGLFLAGAAANTFGTEPNPSEAIAGVGLSGFLTALFFLVRSHRRGEQHFDAWIATHSVEIQRGGASIGSVLVTPDTLLAQYQAVFSFLIVTFKFPTRVYLVEHERTWLAAAACSAVSLIFGWWGLPWGPIYTVQVVAKNLGGGLRITASDRLRALQPRPG